MKNPLLALPLALLLAAPASARGAEPARLAALPATTTAAQPAASLHERLLAARARHAPSGLPDLLSERQRRRIERLRPLGPDSLGSLERRQKLGDRTVTSAQDGRLGSEVRRQLLAGRTLRSIQPRQRRR